MPYLHRVCRCSRPRPDESRWGDVWQCDACGNVWAFTLLGWLPRRANPAEVALPAADEAEVS